MRGGKIINSPVVAISAYCCASILMTLVNKAVLSSYAFNANFLLLAIQSGVCLVVLRAAKTAGLVSHRPFDQLGTSYVLLIIYYHRGKAMVRR